MPALRLFLMSAAAVSFAAQAADFPAPEKLAAHPALPDPLVMFDGSAVKTKADWRERRVPELRALFQHYMYGAMPPIPAVTATVRREDTAALGGKATVREVLVKVGAATPVQLLVVIPNQRTKPAPVFLGMNFSGNYALVSDPLVEMPTGWVLGKYAGTPENHASEKVRGTQAEAWAIDQSIERGYAVATFFSGDLISDESGLAREQLQHFLPPGMKADAPDAPATIGVWAWGFSRMIDYLVTVPELDAKRIAVVGHSRNGKAALVAAAMDERIALAIPSQAGCGGTAPSRVAPELAELQANGRPKVETVAVINHAFPHWFDGYFKAFDAQPDLLPFDQHELVALCAPRPILFSCATEDEWSNPSGQFAMLQAADPVYRLIAGEGLGASEMPPTSELLNSRLGYFIRPGKHSMTRSDWKAWLDFADRWLR